MKKLEKSKKKIHIEMHTANKQRHRLNVLQLCE